jgi:hypothetical protein
VVCGVDKVSWSEKQIRYGMAGKYKQLQRPMRGFFAALRMTNEEGAARSVYIPPIAIGLRWMGHPSVGAGLDEGKSSSAVRVHPTHRDRAAMDGAPERLGLV